jgi:hypothetical protein
MYLSLCLKITGKTRLNKNEPKISKQYSGSAFDPHTIVAWIRIQEVLKKKKNMDPKDR